MRYVPVILFVIVLAAPFVLRRVLVPSSAESGHAAGTERLVIVTPHPADIRNEFSRAFSAWHREHYGSDVELDFRVPGGTNDIKRLLETTYRKSGDSQEQLQDDVSMVWGGGDFFFDQELKPLGVLQPIQMPPALLQQFRDSFPLIQGGGLVGGLGHALLREFRNSFPLVEGSGLVGALGEALIQRFRNTFGQPTLAGVKLYEAGRAADGTPAPRWIGICLSSFGICYNPDVYHLLGLAEPSPEHGWEDLTNPRLAGFIALADPAHSGSSAVAYQMVIQHQMALAEKGLSDPTSPLYSRELLKLPREKWATSAPYNNAVSRGWKLGMAELLRIAANARYFTDSSTLVPMDVSRGEAAAGVAIDFYARVTEETVGSSRLRFFAPIGATAITPDPIAILNGAKGRKLELAQHFIEFLLSPGAQRLWELNPHTPGGPAGRSLRRMPIRRDVYRDRTGWADDINPFETANGFNQRGEWMKLFIDTRPIWVAAWIDSRDDLKRAYSQILRLPDDARRRALLDELANLPIEMSDVDALRIERKRLEASHGEVDEWKANQQIAWARKFRDHYRAIANQAGG